MDTIDTWETKALLDGYGTEGFPFTCAEIIAELKLRYITDENDANKGGIHPKRPL